MRPLSELTCGICVQPLFKENSEEGQRDKFLVDHYKQMRQTCLSSHYDCVVALPVTRSVDLKDHRDLQPVKIQGKIIEKTEPVMFCTGARFECPVCTNTHHVRQLTTQFLEPVRCSCGRKGKFTLVEKETEPGLSLVLMDGEFKLYVPFVPIDLIGDAKLGDVVTIAGSLRYDYAMEAGKLTRITKPCLSPLKIEVISKGNGQNPRDYLLEKKAEGFLFEDLVVKILKNKGYEAKVTKKSGDGGIDFVAVIDGRRVVGQCKHHLDQTISASQMRDFLGAMVSTKEKQGMFVCTGKFSQNAQVLANENNVECWDLDRVLFEMGDLDDFDEQTEPVKLLSGDELKKLKDELVVKFEARFKEVSKGLGSNMVPNEQIQPMFNDQEWNILRSSLGPVGSGYSFGKNFVENWSLTCDVSLTSIPASVRGDLIKVKTWIKELEEEKGRNIFLEHLVTRAAREDMDEKTLMDLVKKLKFDGDLYEPRKGFVSRV